MYTTLLLLCTALPTRSLALQQSFWNERALHPAAWNDDASNSSRRGYVLTFGGDRWLSTARNLAEAGFTAIPISPVPLDSTEINQYRAKSSPSEAAVQVYDNMLSFWHILDLISKNSSTTWSYVFEDDVMATPGVAVDQIPELLDFAEAKALESGDDLLYGGVCLYGVGDSTADWSKDGIDIGYTAGRCAHAWAVAPGKASNVRMRAEQIQNDPGRVNPCADIYFDCQLEQMAMESKHGGFVTPGVNKCGNGSTQQKGHCGVFMQDRQIFQTTIR